MKNTNYFSLKKILVFVVFMLGLNCFAQSQQEKVRVGVLHGPSCIPTIKLIEDSSDKYSFEKYADPQALLPKLLKNEIDIGFLPLNVAAKVYNSTNKQIVCLAVSGNGNLCIISKNSRVKKLSDLKGKSVFIAGRGATPEYIFKYILKKNNISYSDEETNSSKVYLDYSIQTANLVPSLISRKIEFALVPEPFSTIAKVKDKTVKKVIDIQQEFEDITIKDNTFPLTVIVATSDFINKTLESAEEENQIDIGKELVLKFLEDYEDSYKWTISNSVKAGKLFEKHNMGLASGIVTASIPNANYVFIKAKDAKKSCEDLLTIFLQNDEKSIGGKLPDSDFYY